MRRAWLVATVAIACLGCNDCDGLGEPIHPDCGNGVVDDLEVCDGTALGSESCASQGFEGGTLRCASTCGGFVVAQCDGVRDALDPCSLCLPSEECRGGSCVSTCDGEPFVEDTELEFDIEVVRVAGTVSFGDATVRPPSALRFVGDVYWEPAIVPIRDDGTYEVALPPGRYQVTWEPEVGFAGASEGLPDIDVGGLPDVDLAAEHDFALTPWADLELEVVTDFPDELGSMIVEPLDPRFGRIQFSLASTEPLRLRSGDYRIWWAHEDDSRRDVVEYLETVSFAELQARGTIEIPVVHTELAVTINGGAPYPGGTVRAELIRSEALPRPGWLSIGEDRERWDLDASGRASGWMLDRPRNVALVLNGPPVWGWIWAKRDVPAAAEIAIDVAMPRLAGEVLRNGERLPNSQLDGAARGRLEFSSDEGALSVELSERGRGDFAVRLPRGLWDVRVSGLIFAGVLPVVPWAAPSITVGGDIDEHVIDVPAVRLAGQLTVNGVRSDDEVDLQTRGELQLRTPGESAWFTVPIPARGPAGWDVIVAPGTYEAELARWWFATGSEPAPLGALPLGAWALGDLAVPVATRYDIDVRVHDVSVALEADPEPARPGVLWFIRRPDDRVSRQIASGDAPVTVSLYPGHYRVEWAPLDDDGHAVDPVVLESALRVDGPIERRYDVGQVELRGTILVNGAPAENAGDLDVQLTRAPSANSIHHAALDASGPATFTTQLVRGHYAVVLSASADHEVLPGHGVVLHQACHDARLD